MTIKKLKSLIRTSLANKNKERSSKTMANLSSKLDKAFTTLEIAVEIEEKGDKIVKNLNNKKDESSSKQIERYMEAAAKYYEACTMMKSVLNEKEFSDKEEESKKLIKEKIEYYENHALTLLQGKDSSSRNTIRKRQGSKKYVSNVSKQLSDRSIDVEQTWTRGHDLSFSPVASSIPTESCRHLNCPTEPPILDKAGRANACLSNALDLDERTSKHGNKNGPQAAIEEYMKAARIYIECLKIVEQQRSLATVGNNDEYLGHVLKSRLEGALDRVEYLKSAAFSNTSALSNKKEVSKVAASKLKSSAPASAAPSSPSLKLSALEIDVLKRSSLLTSGLFLPWSDEDTCIDFTNNRKVFSDPEGYLKLSPTQQKRYSKWARPSEILALRSKVIKEKDKPVMVQNITPYSIRQTCVTDCSFIASLCICAANERRFNRKLITSIVYPQDASGNPVYNPYGLYMVKLWLNGIARRVIVDDLFPIDKRGKLLCSHTSSSDTSVLELWVTIIEKAYMKLCGGYDFPGSNSGIDLFSLTGWIPERLVFASNETSPRDFETPSERAWERLYGASSFGDCLITVSTTSDLTDARAKELGLVSDHAYAVLNVVKTEDGARLLQLKNPWAKSAWKGTATTGVAQETKRDDGVFWIDWSDILIFFRNFHLSWNPDLFTSRYTIHGLWLNTVGPDGDSWTVGDNPQYILTLSDAAIHCKGGTSLWILLSRHVNKQEQEGTVASEFLTLHIYRNTDKKERIWYSGGENRVLLGAYTNNPHVLIRYDVTCPNDRYLSLVLSQYNKQKSAADLGYTLSCYCTHSFTFGDHVELPKIVKVLLSEWRDGTAGGSPRFPSFVTNPMWLIQVPKQGAHVMFTCSSSEKIAVNVMLCNFSKTRGDLFPLRKDAVLLESGDYRFGFVVTCRIFLRQGEYTCIVSSFEALQFGCFTLSVYSTVSLPIDEIL